MEDTTTIWDILTIFVWIGYPILFLIQWLFFPWWKTLISFFVGMGMFITSIHLFEYYHYSYLFSMFFPFIVYILFLRIAFHKDRIWW